MNSAADFLKTEAKLRTLAFRITTSEAAETVWRLLEDLHANKRTVADLSDEELRMIVAYDYGDGVDVTKLTNEELEAEIERPNAASSG
jgi:hypothetical protein